MSETLRIRHDPIGAWRAVHVSNSLISLAVAPSIGGRVIDLRLGETKIFYANPRHYGAGSPPDVGSSDFGMWRNYGGSKVWPAPQGWSSDDEWPGPPDPILDAGPYSYRVSQDGKVAVHLESPHDDYSGVTLERDIEVEAGTSIVHLHHRMRNSSKRSVRWAIWQVTQVDAANGLDIIVPANGFHQTLGDKPYAKIGFDSSTKRVHLTYDNQVAKFAVEANAGWFASLDRARGVVLVETFPIEPGASYPDDAPAAFWISGAGTFTIHGDRIDMTADGNGCDPHVEAEIMGPLTRLEPGESCEMRTAWRVAAIQADTIVSANHCGAVGRKLAFERGRITGSFGVFHEANLELVAFDRASQVAVRFPLGAVSPLRPVILDEGISLPAGTVRCSLMLFDQNKNRLGILDHVQVR